LEVSVWEDKNKNEDATEFGIIAETLEIL